MQAADPLLSPTRRSAGFCAVTTELVLVERELPDALLGGAAALAASSMSDLHVQLRAEDVGRAFRSAHAGFRALAADMAMLAHAYAICTGEPLLDIRLERITDDACRAFHRDNVQTRLLVTYAGPGTQYVADADGCAALRLQRRFKGPIYSVPLGAVAWMRGAQAGGGPGLVHRSPPISGQGHVRLLMAVNAASKASPELWTAADGPVLCSLRPDLTS